MKLKQSYVDFNEVEHTYHLKGKELQGITSTLIKAVFGDYTATIPQDTLQKAQERGTYIHKEIERIDSGTSFATDPETMAYVQLITQANLTHVASEYIVTDGEHFASPIDKVYENDGIYIADIKTTSTLHWAELRFQLSWYATYFQLMNHRAVKGALVIWLPQERYGECSIMPVEIVSADVIHAVEKGYLAGEDVTQYAKCFETAQNLPTNVSNIVEQLSVYEGQISALKEKEKVLSMARDEFNQQLIEQYFLPTSAKKIELPNMTLTYMEGTIRTSIDTKALKADHPELFDKYKKETAVKETVRITMKKN